jgi:hypothetical protein
MKVINLWAGPGAGKSTTAAGLFYLLKLEGKKVELVTEFAKDLVYAGRSLDDQLYILAKQNQRLTRLSGVVDYAITDSPLPLSVLYAKRPFDEEWFRKAAFGIYHTYDNVDFVVERLKPYQTYGRVQSSVEQAKEIDEAVESLLFFNNIPFTKIPGDATGPGAIAKQLGF